MTTTTTSPSSPRPPITTAATAFVHSYARAMALSSPTSSPHSANLPLIAAALGAHYATNTTAYTLGHRRVFPSTAGAVTALAVHLGRFKSSGLGYDIQMAAHRVEPVSASSALCWVTWAINPKEGSGKEGWQWENVYGYRFEEPEAGLRKWIGGEEDGWEKPEGWWELILSDNEIAGLVARVPNFMEL
ncbi:hypothetical protein B0H13DRAFT_1937513 [Mycena leptocephala]|nr:hypothetical protein B0H13DRAFT_1937513 [Mycena leptocephala]